MVRMVLRRSAAGWRIDDMAMDHVPSLRRLLRRPIACLPSPQPH
jgi:hypothetical protein